MDKQKIIIGLIIVIIALAAVILVSNLNPAKTDSQITVTSKSELSSNDSYTIKLTDINNNPIAGQEVNITITGSNGTKTTKTITTADSGKAKCKLKEFEGGNYTVQAIYGGNEKYSGCNNTQKIEIINKAEDTQPTKTVSETTSDSSSDNNEEHDDGYWETSPDAPFEYHTEYYPDGELRQFDHDGNLVGSTYEEDQAYLAEKFPRN